MFKRIKVITLLISVLLVLGIMQLISAGIFINALNNDKENFTVSQLSSQNVAEFTDAWISLNQARVTLNRGMLRLQSSMASQINGGQLNELVNTAKNLLADAQAHYDKYYALPENCLSVRINLAVAIADLCEPGAEHDGDIDAYRKVVEDIRLMQGGFRPAQPGEINILTYHKAKGLEFDIVFCLEAYRFIMPPYRYEEMQFDAYGQSLAMHYVGITRAKKVCYILLGTQRHNKDGRLKDAEPSVFLTQPGLKELRNESNWDLPIK